MSDQEQTQPEDPRAPILAILEDIRVKITENDAPAILSNLGTITSPTSEGPIIHVTQIDLRILLPHTEQGKQIVGQIIAQTKAQIEEKQNPKRIVVARG